MKPKILVSQKAKIDKGITLIALVITIIVLLILATVSIATLTGENGILSKANTAKTETEKAGAKEKVQMAVMSSFDNTRKIDYSELKTNLDKVEGINKPIPDITNLPITVKVDGYDVTINEEGKVIVVGENTGDNPSQNPSTLITIEEAKNRGTVLDENNPTTMIDTYGNEVILPEGFKVAEESAIDVTGGVVIEDVNHGDTATSQFVWIPVGKIYTSSDKSTSEIITLGRYVFEEDGTINTELSKSEPGGKLKNDSSANNYYTEALKEETTSNIHAKDIESFRISANSKKGYYIGRYEARSVTQRTSASDVLGQITVKANDFIYNYVTQIQAATLAREMYGEDKKFTSDLVNSYAWDTAIAFLQIFDNRSNKSKVYSRQTTLTNALAPYGTNNLTDSIKQDKICNIWDMASNTIEWNTETYSDSSSGPSVNRGGNYHIIDNYTCYRYRVNPNSAQEYRSFRCILYL